MQCIEENNIGVSRYIDIRISMDFIFLCLHNRFI